MLRDLSIRVFNVCDVIFSDSTSIESKIIENKTLKLGQSSAHPDKICTSNTLLLDKAIKEIDIAKDKRFSEHIKSYTVNIIPPDKRNIEINTVMDFIPISVKALGKIGEGITYTIYGAKIMLTGCDIYGEQAGEFGASNGILSEQVKFDKAGTPSSDEYIIHIDVLFYKKAISSREAVNAAHILTDLIFEKVRTALKKLDATKANERHDYPAKTDKPNAKKVIIIKQVAGQGAMYDTRLMGYEPCGFEGGYSIIDMNSMPVMITPNEYRDGAIRALY